MNQNEPCDSLIKPSGYDLIEDKLKATLRFNELKELISNKATIKESGLVLINVFANKIIHKIGDSKSINAVLDEAIKNGM